MPVSPANRDNVRNPEWVAAAIREVLASPYALGLMESLAGEIEIWTDAADETVAAITQRKGLKPLNWEREYRTQPGLRAHVPYWDVGDSQQAAEAWAAELGLAENLSPVVAGTREWVSEVEGWRVLVWVIANYDAFREDTEKS